MKVLGGLLLLAGVLLVEWGLHRKPRLPAAFISTMPLLPEWRDWFAMHPNGGGV